MKRVVILMLISIVAVNISAQVFGTSSTLSKNKFSLGLEPSIYTSGNYEDFMFFIHGGYGLKSGVDLGVKLGLLGDENYIGADVEFVLGKKFSLSGGFHDFYDFSIDGTALFSFPLGSAATLSSGLDMDIILAEPETIVPLWIPIVVEIGIKDNMVFILEAELDTKLIDESYHFLGGGLQFFF